MVEAEFVKIEDGRRGGCGRVGGGREPIPDDAPRRRAGGDARVRRRGHYRTGCAPNTEVPEARRGYRRVNRDDAIGDITAAQLRRCVVAETTATARWRDQ